MVAIWRGSSVEQHAARCACTAAAQHAPRGALRRWGCSVGSWTSAATGASCWHGAARRWRRGTRGRAAIASRLMATPPVGEPLSNPATTSAFDGVVVLGGAISAAISADRGVPTLNRDADRLMAFAALARAWPDARLVFAGGPSASVPGRLTEAEASRVLLEQLAVAPDRVMYDEQSRTTWENAVNARALAHPKPGETWVLVTSASHMPRAMGAFRGTGWPPMLPWPIAYRTTNSGWPAPLQPMGTKLMALDLAAHEWVGLAVYRLQGRTDRLLPKP